MRENAAGRDQRDDIAQILAILDDNRPRGRVDGLDRTRMPLHGQSSRRPGERCVQPPLLRRFRETGRIPCTALDHHNHSLGCERGTGGDVFDPRRLQDGRRIVTDAEIAFDRPFHVRLGQPPPDHSAFRRIAFGDRVHVRRGAAHVHDDERSKPGAVPAALGEQTRTFHDGRGRGHQHFVETLRRGVDSLGMDNAFDEHLTYRLSGRLDVERPEVGHDIFRHDGDLAGSGETSRNVVGHRTVARHEHGTVER